MSSSRREILLLALPGLALVLASVFLIRGHAAEVAPTEPVFSRHVAAPVATAADEVHPRSAHPADAPIAGAPRVGLAPPRPLDPPVLVPPFGADPVELILEDGDGKRIPAARVRVRALPAATVATAEDLLAAQLVHESVTDEQGRLGFSREPGRVYEVEVEAEGFARKRYRLIDPGRRILRVHREGRLAGYVRDVFDRLPLAGVEVQLWHDGGRQEVTHTDAEGRYFFDAVTPEEATLRVVSADHLRQIRYIRVVPGAIDWHDFDLEPGRRVEVETVDAAERRLAGVPVDLVELNSGLLVGRRLSDERGRVTFSALREGRDYMVMADDAEFGGGRAVFSVAYTGATPTAAQVVTRRLTVREGWSLRGRVVMEGPEGRTLPVEGARLVFESDSLGAFAASRHRADAVYTDAEGRFEVDGLFAGAAYSALIIHPDFALQILANLEESRSEIGAAVTLRNSRRIEGRVQDENGVPVPFATVFVSIPGSSGQLGGDLVVGADEFGRYVIDRFGAGDEIQVQAADSGRGGRSAPQTLDTDLSAYTVIQTTRP